MAAARVRPSVADASLAVVLCASATVEVFVGAPDAPLEAQLAGALLTTLPLAWRSVAPVPTVAASAGGFTLACALGLSGGDLIVATLVPLVAVYSVAVSSSRAGIVAGAAISLAAYAVAALVAPEWKPDEILMAAIGIAVTLVVGGAVRVMGLEADVLQERAAELERERDERARVAVTAERARIARELHDVIGHSISVMGLQAGAVRRLLTPEQERERDALLSVERLGRDAVAEMRRLLGFLREEEAAGQDRAPPTPRRVDDLVAEMRRAGLDVELSVEGNLEDLSPGRALAAFRILQEALTNALKHAPEAHVRAALRQTPAGVEIEVVDDGRAAPGSTANGGQGLVGMRERVTMYGGTLDAGRRDDHGFAVVAHLPAAGA